MGHLKSKHIFFRVQYVIVEAFYSSFFCVVSYTWNKVYETRQHQLD